MLFAAACATGATDSLGDLDGDAGDGPTDSGPDRRDAGPGSDAGPGAPPEAGARADADGTDGGDADTGAATCGGPGAPLSGTPGQWTWIDDPATRCGNGTTTGYAINVQPGAKRLVIFLMGGGACFDQASCSGADPQHQAAHVSTGYKEPDFQSEQQQLLGAGTIFDRSAAENPVKDDAWVFVPYCTGDMHSGSTVAPYGTYHVGFTNMHAMLARVVPTFCRDVERVILAGSSAGGWGAVFNYAQVKTAFGATRVDLVDDSGPPLSPEWFPLQTTMRATWGAAANAPAGCAGCASSWAAFFPYYAQAYPGARFSLIQSAADPSVCPFFGLYDPNQCSQAMHAFYTQTMQPLANGRMWLSDAFQHVWLGNVFYSATSAGVPLTSFVTKQVNDDPTWASVVP